MKENTFTMYKEQEEILAIIEEMIGAALSLSQGIQNYESFIRARETGIKKIKESFIHRKQLNESIKALHNLVKD